MAVPALLGQGKRVIEVAMLDLAGATRGADPQSVTLLTDTWGGSVVQQFASDAELKPWEAKWPSRSKRLVVKIIYDRSAGELRVWGHGPADAFTNSFPVDSDLRAAMAKAKAYIESQIRR
jgi:hypothetical protein